MNISIKTIPVKQMRYKTAGDWFFTEKGDLEIKVIDLGNWQMEFIIAIHELVEVMLCKHKGITQKDVDDFDMSEYGLSLEEPGLDPKAPYCVEHMIALKVEQVLYKYLGVDEKEFDKKMLEVIEGYDKERI